MTAPNYSRDFSHDFVAEVIEKATPRRPRNGADAQPDAEPGPGPTWHTPGPDTEGPSKERGHTGDDPPPTWRTLADIDDAPPGPLLMGMLEPNGPTLMYAAPGVGKGTTGAHLAVSAQELGMRPMIYDAECREREWARRVSGLGGDRSGIVYVQPQDLGARYAGRPLWESVERLRAVVTDSGGDVLFVDSILPATNVGEERLRSDAQAPFLYVAALDSLGVPNLSFGHPPKTTPAGDPYGSMGWIAAYRLIWLGTEAEGKGHRVRWRPRKRNERGLLGGLLMTFDYDPDGRPCGVTVEDDDEVTLERILAILVRGPQSVSDITDELLEDVEDVTEERVRRLKATVGKALNRMHHTGLVAREGNTRGARWLLPLRA